MGVLLAPAPPSLPPAHPAQVLVDTCPTPGCGQKRIAPLCPRRLCRKHCRQLGGCLVKTHFPDKAPPSTNIPPPSLGVALPTLASPPHQPPSLSLPLAQAQSFLPRPPVAGPSTLPSSETLDALPDARYVSHMPTIFTEQLRREQELLEDQRQRDAERIQNEKRAKHSVVIYAWNKDASPPLIRMFQAGFTWPFFVLTPRVLSLVGLAEAADHGGLQMYETASLGAWVHIDGGHTLEVREGHRIFIKDVAVHDYQDFDQHHVITRQSTPHLRYDLATERASIRERSKAANACSSAKRKASLSLSPSPFSAPRLRDTYTPSLSPTSSSTSFSPPLISPPSPPAVVKPEPTMNNSVSFFSGSINDPIELSDGEERRWPGDFFVDEVVPGLQEQKKTTKGQHKAVFERRYPGITYRRSTVFDQVKKWKEAPAQLKDVCQGGERIRWSVFVKRLKKGKMLASTSVIDLSDSE